MDIIVDIFDLLTRAYLPPVDKLWGPKNMQQPVVLIVCRSFQSAERKKKFLLIVDT